MRLRAVLPTLGLATLALCAQDKASELLRLPPVVEQQAAIIPIKTLSGDSFNRLANMLSVFKVEYRADEKLRTILVYARPDVISQIRKVIDELDRPGSEAAIGRNIEMTLTFLRCNTYPQAASSDLPPDMESVAKQMRAATQCKSIELWDTIPLRLQEGKVTEQNVRLPGSLPEMPGAITTGQIRISPEAVTRKESGRYVRFDTMRINLRVPYLTSKQAPHPGAPFSFMDVSLNTSGDFKEGQKTVLGKLSGAEDATSTFVVVALKILD